MITQRQLLFVILLVPLYLPTTSLAESIDFDIVPGTHPTPSSVQVELSTLLSSAEDKSSISGQATLEMQPSSEPFDFVSIDTMHLEIVDGMDLSLLGGLLRATAEPGSTRVTLIEPGIPTPVR